MSNLKVLIDDEIVMNGSASNWEQQPPEFLTEQLTKISQKDFVPEPYLRALMLVIAEAALTSVDTVAEVTTFGHQGWFLQVKYAEATKG